MSRVRLGKKKHTIYRDARVNMTGNAGGAYVNGEWVEPDLVELSVTMNVQPNFSSFQTRALPAGDREKEAIWFSSNDWLYTSDSGSKPHAADLIFYRGSYWKVMTCSPFGNFGTHCEGIAIKLNRNEQPQRLEGEIGVIRESYY